VTGQPITGAANGVDRPIGTVHRVAAMMKHEAGKMALIVLYLWLLFGLFALHDMLISRRLGLGFEFEGFAIINALVLGKVMLIAEDFNFGAGRKGRPLIYPILRQAALFALLFMAFHSIEAAVLGLIQGETPASGVTELGGGGIVTAVLFIALVPYFAFRNITRELGWPNMRRLLFAGSGASETNVTIEREAAKQTPGACRTRLD
jgi:hypothetical protein